ncbi:uncharacterized protein LOC133831530 [Humulus lupulus]|uniref:uncharacterized protein LOC133831530 n=1 Tax=Humulus lupulus TaxID=3486 RepID=UPI002B40B85A|nr:uncharacterized protein LOC133831530 [Humulus lupulus]
MQKLYDHQYNDSDIMAMAAVSLEAMAMADLNHHHFDMDFEEWERRELDQSPPAHLLADDDEEEEEEKEEEKDDNISPSRREEDEDIRSLEPESRVLSFDNMKRLLIVWVNKLLCWRNNLRLFL